MREWPKAIVERFPLPEYANVKRPWWHVVLAGVQARNGAGKSAVARTDADVVAIDREQPLPHPGYRTGQIWANEFGNSIQICREVAGWLTIAASDVLLVKRGDDLGGYCFLVADPACPWLAPWAPQE